MILRTAKWPRAVGRHVLTPVTKWQKPNGPRTARQKWLLQPFSASQGFDKRLPSALQPGNPWYQHLWPLVTLYFRAPAETKGTASLCPLQARQRYRRGLAAGRAISLCSGSATHLAFHSFCGAPRTLWEDGTVIALWEQWTYFLLKCPPFCSSILKNTIEIHTLCHGLCKRNQVESCPH